MQQFLRSTAETQGGVAVGKEWIKIGGRPQGSPPVRGTQITHSDHLPEHTFCSRRTADVTHADQQHAVGHILSSPSGSCCATPNTLSPAQLAWAQARVPGADLRLQDYRDLNERFDHAATGQEALKPSSAIRNPGAVQRMPLPLLAA